MTKLDKMIMKRNTASFIQGTYREALDKLNKDSLTLSKDLDYIERAVKLSKFEALDLREIYQAAKQVSKVNQDAKQTIYSRDKKLPEQNALSSSKMSSSPSSSETS